MILEVDNISFNFTTDAPLFKDISFSVKQGEILSIVGPSGVGKSTLLKCISGILPIDKGTVFLEGNKIRDPRELLKPGHPDIALVHQAFILDEYFTVEENLSNHLHHLRTKEGEKKKLKFLEVFDLHRVAHTKSKYISGGEKQRLSMACALAKEPKCLLLDEPFVHLDIHLHKKIGDYLKKIIKAKKLAVILVTHNGNEALSWSDKILMMRNGKINSIYSPEQAYYKPKNKVEGKYFGELNSLYIEGKQILFRPTAFSIMPNEKYIHTVEVQYKNTDFRGFYYAHSFKTNAGKEIVIYSSFKTLNISKIYV